MSDCSSDVSPWSPQRWYRMPVGECDAPGTRYYPPDAYYCYPPFKKPCDPDRYSPSCSSGDDSDDDDEEVVERVIVIRRKKGDGKRGGKINRKPHCTCATGRCRRHTEPEESGESSSEECAFKRGARPRKQEQQSLKSRGHIAPHTVTVPCGKQVATVTRYDGWKSDAMKPLHRSRPRLELLDGQVDEFLTVPSADPTFRRAPFPRLTDTAVNPNMWDPALTVPRAALQNEFSQGDAVQRQRAFESWTGTTSLPPVQPGAEWVNRDILAEQSGTYHPLTAQERVERMHREYKLRHENDPNKKEDDTGLLVQIAEDEGVPNNEASKQWHRARLDMQRRDAKEILRNAHNFDSSEFWSARLPDSWC